MGDGQGWLPPSWEGSNLLEQVEVPQAAVVTDYSDAIVIDQEAAGGGDVHHQPWG